LSILGKYGLFIKSNKNFNNRVQKIKDDHFLMPLLMLIFSMIKKIYFVFSTLFLLALQWNTLGCNLISALIPADTKGSANLSEFLKRTVLYRTVPHRTAPHRTVSYRTVPYRIVPYRTVSYRIVPYRTVPYRTGPYRTALYRTVPYRTVPYRTALYRTAPYRTVPYSNRPSIVLENSAKSTKNAIFYQNVWRF
jgi:hypothetical protein